MKSNRFFAHKAISEIKDPLGDRDFYEHEGTIPEKKKSPILNLGILFAFILLASLSYKLFRLQVDEGYINLKLSQGNIVRNIPQAAPRGEIVDDSGQVLASNLASYQLVTQINRVKDLNKISDGVFASAEISRDDVKKAIEKQATQPGYVVLKDDIPRDDALLMKSRLPVDGPFEIMPTFLRDYPDQSLSHILGYVGKPTQTEINTSPAIAVNGVSGKDGLERTFDQFLQGIPGSTSAEVNANNQLIRNISSAESIVGNTLKTTIDLGLQQEMYTALKAETDKLHVNAAAVAIDPRDGSIKALVSLPDYNNNLFSGGLTQNQLDAILNDPNKPMLDRVTSGQYPSGSSIKPFEATAALAAGVITSSTAFHTPAFIKVGGHQFPDWKDHSAENTNVEMAIAQSNNVFFYSVGGGNPNSPIKTGLGPDGIKSGLEKFGFGQATGINLPGEASGFLPTPAWKKRTTGEDWYIGDSYNLAIGQGGLLVSPLQIANATAAIANGGKLFEPYLVSEVLNSQGKPISSTSIGPKLINSSIFPLSDIQTVQTGMRMTLQNGGSAYSVFGPNFPINVAGKTGTAQYGNQGNTHAWFTSYAPYENPKLVITILVEGGGEGNVTAAPVAKDIYSWWAANRNK